MNERVDSGQDKRLEQLLKRLADYPDAIIPVADFVELLAKSRNPRR